MIYIFDDYTLDVDRHELCRAGQVVEIEPKVFQVLLYLLEHRDRVVTKDDLFTHCWPETFVSEAALTRCLAKVRQAVQASRAGTPIIKTIHRQGYRLMAAVTSLPAEPAAALQQEIPPSPAPPAVTSAPPSAPLMESVPLPSAPDIPAPAPPRRLGAERRQVTVLCCTLVDAARLVRECDPEDLHAVMHASHTACATIIERFAGHLAQYRDDGVRAYFGYPQAHDDDAPRAIYAGLQLVETLGQQPEVARVLGEALQVRVGIHTGLVVVGQREGDRSPPLAVGDTPTVAAALQTLAPPGTVVMSATTARLVAGYFVCEPLEAPELPDVAVALPVSRVVRPSGAQTRLDVATPRGLTPFVGREQELGLLLARWEQATDGLGQMVLLSGEAGIGKSRLVEVLSEQVLRQDAIRMVFRCSPYAQQSALHPVIEHLQRRLHWHHNDTPEVKLHTLEQALQTSRLPLEDVVPLLAALLSIPLPERYPPLSLSPQRQKQQTLEALGAWLLAETERQPVLAVWEDIHWADPSTLGWLSLLLDQTPTAQMLTLLLFRPEFRLPWSLRSHLTQLTLSR
jgi:class 3 adenylate cyclase